MPGESSSRRCPERTECVLLSGATGFVGMEILGLYLERTDRHLCCVVRAESQEDADARMRSALGLLFGDELAFAGRISAIRGDIEWPGMGLAPAEIESLAARVTDIVHCAASVSFTLPLARSREINVDGTRHMLDFGIECLSRGGLGHFAYVSTAYVAGTHQGVFTEEDLNVGQDFRNAYERSKFEAEQLVRTYSDRLPIQVFRPSIIVGEQSSGWTMSFNVLYTPLKAFSRGALPAIPATPNAPVDVVPVDYVAGAVFEVANRPAGTGAETYHLVAGPQATTVRRLVELSAKHLDRPQPVMIPPKLYSLVQPALLRLTGARRRRAIGQMQVFFPYFSSKVRYGNRSTTLRLGSEPPEVEGYYHRLIDFAAHADWGRTQPARIGSREKAGSSGRS
jgi:thioester reductase-like protein